MSDSPQSLRRPPGGVTILVVDDEDVVRRLVARMLQEQGYQVLVAVSGDDALRMLQRAALRVRAVVTDLSMPGLKGGQLGDTIATCWPHLRVLYMSGYPAARMVGEGGLDPSRPFIQKPFTAEQLGRRMRELLAAPAAQ